MRRWLSRLRPDPARREMKRQLRARRKHLRAELARRKKAARRPSRRRRWRWWLLALLLLLIAALLLRNCSCAEPDEIVEPEPPPAPAAAPAEPEPEPEAEAPLAPAQRVQRRDRPEYSVDSPEPVPWLSSFRMQVSARSPRLAECFVGADRPGALKWTTSVEPVEGHVSEHSLEPTLLSDGLTRKQRTCVLGVLSSPPYKLESAGERSTPTRVGMVIEF